MCPFIPFGNCVGNVTGLMTSNTFAVVNSATNLNSLFSLTPECVDELNFWKDNIVHINDVPLWPYGVLTPVIDLLATTTRYF